MSASLLGLGFRADMGTCIRKLVLLKLVDACEEDGTRIFPAIATVARAAQCSPRQVQREIRAFVSVGLLKLVREGGKGPRSTNEYAMDIDVLMRLAREGWNALPAALTGDADTDADGETEADPSAAKGDTQSPLSQPQKGDTGDIPRVTGETPKGDTHCHPTPPDPSLDPSSEKERGREDREREERKSIERAFERAWQAWPTSVGDSRPEALKAWMALLPAERLAAAEEAERYIAALKDVGRKHIISHAVYLREKRWTQLPPKPDPSAPTGPRLVAPWGPLWAELVARALAAGPIEVSAPQITRESRAASYAEVRARFGDAAAAERYARLGHEIGPDGELLFPPDFEARIWREHVAANGYPKVKRLYQAASEGKSVQLGDGFVESGAAFEAVPVGLKVWGEWKAFFAARGWPWMPHTGKQPVVYFPAGGPDGWSAFEDRIRQSEGKGHHADGTGMAAE